MGVTVCSKFESIWDSLWQLTIINKFECVGYSQLILCKKYAVNLNVFNWGFSVDTM